MKIIIAATKKCTHRPKLEEQLQNAGLQYEVLYFEDHPELIETYKLKTSPLLIVDDKIASIGMPERSQIIELKNKNKTSRSTTLKKTPIILSTKPLKGDR